MPKPRREWLLGALRLAGGSISAGAALVSILSYTTSSHAAAGGTRAHRLALAPSPDSAGAIGECSSKAFNTAASKRWASLAIWSSAC